MIGRRCGSAVSQWSVVQISLSEDGIGIRGGRKADFFGCWRWGNLKLRDTEPLRPYRVEQLELFTSEPFAFPTPPPEFSAAVQA